MTALQLIPAAETNVYSKLPRAVKDELNLWAKIIDEVEHARSKNRVFTEISKSYPAVRSLSAANIRTKYYAFKRRGWQALVNKSKLKRSDPAAPDMPCSQPLAFVEFWKGLQESYQRNSRAAYRELLRRFRTGDQVPGIGNWRKVWIDKYGTPPPAACPIDPPLPAGWSLRNLQRIKPTKFELTAVRIGRGAAAQFRPLVYTTRVGGAPGQCYVFDDVWGDNKVNFLGVNKQAMRPLEFSCLDLFSGCQVAWGAQPMLENEATGKREMLRETEMRFLLAHVLCSIGYHPAGCSLHVEHGTAAIREELAERIAEWTDGAVSVLRGGIQGAAAHDGFFMSRGKGNSRFKAALESHHNLKHNELAALPGQVGKDREHSPEELHGRDQYNNTLIKAFEQLPANRADLLMMPFLEFNQWKQVVGEVYDRINWRTEHEIEGFVEAGLVVSEYRLFDGGDWLPVSNLLKLPAEKRAAVEVLLNAPGAVRSRKLSPAEVWNLGRKNLVRLPAHYVPILLGPRNARKLRLGDNGLFEFQDRRMGPGIFRFLSQVQTEGGESVALRPGSTFHVYATPFDARAVFVATVDDEFIGIAPRWETVASGDIDAIHRQIGRSMKFESELLAPVRARHAAEARAKKQMHDHNARVLSGAPVTAAEVLADERIQRETGDLSDVFDFDRNETPEFSADDISNILRN